MIIVMKLFVHPSIAELRRAINLAFQTLRSTPVIILNTLRKLLLNLRQYAFKNCL